MCIRDRYLYHGIKDCNNAAIVPGGGDKQCSHGCMGYGSCVRECEYNAISIIDGVAVINPDLCQACGKCLRVCPNTVSYTHLDVYKRQRL